MATRKTAPQEEGTPAVLDETVEKKATSRTAKAAPKLNIYQIIAKIGEEAGALAPEKSPQGGVPFAFRGVDSVVAHLTPHLRKYGVITVPKVVSVNTTSREISNNKAITQSEVITEFTFYAPDGTSITATTTGLAQDYADRSAAQAQSVAFRVALLQTFTLPTHDKEPEVAGEETQKYIENVAASAPKKAPAAPTGPNITDLKRQVSEQLAGRGIKGGAAIKAYGDRFFAEDIEKDPSKAKWSEHPTPLKKLLEHLKSGEIKEGVDDVN